MAVRPLSIIQLCAPDEVGGLERVVQALAIGHHQRGHQVLVAAIVDPGTRRHPFAEPLLEAGVPVELLEVPARGYRHERRLVRRLYERVRPDVVHSHGYRTDVLDVGIARARRIPVVTTLHGSSRMGGLADFHEWLQLLVLRRFSAVVAVSRPLAAQLSGRWVSPRRLHFIPNAWTRAAARLDSRSEARAALALPQDGQVIGWVGRLIEVKGADVFLEALRLLDRPAVRVAIIGDGRCRPALEQQAQALGLGNQVRFYGSVMDVARRFPAFDLFVMSSRTEGTPVVLFEALAAGVPVVATAVGGVPDVVGSGEALVVPPVDASALAGAMAAALDDPRAAAARAEAGRRRLDANFALTPWLERHEQLYASLTSGSPTS